MTPAWARSLQLGQRVTFTRNLHRRSVYGSKPYTERKVWTPEGYPGQSAPAPTPGIVVGLRTLSDGRNEGGHNYDDPIVYTAERTFLAVLVAWNLRRNPVLVLPKHLTDPAAAELDLEPAAADRLAPPGVQLALTE